MSKASLWSLGLIVACAILWGFRDLRIGLTLLVCASWALVVGVIEGRDVGRAEREAPSPPHRYRGTDNRRYSEPESRKPTGNRVHQPPSGRARTMSGTHVYRYRPALGDVRHNGRGHATET